MLVKEVNVVLAIARHASQAVVKGLLRVEELGDVGVDLLLNGSQVALRVLQTPPASRVHQRVLSAKTFVMQGSRASYLRIAWAAGAIAVA